MNVDVNVQTNIETPARRRAPPNPPPALARLPNPTAREIQYSATIMSARPRPVARREYGTREYPYVLQTWVCRPMSDPYVAGNSKRVEKALGTAIQDMVDQAPDDPVEFLSRRLYELAQLPPDPEVAPPAQAAEWGRSLWPQAEPAMEVAPRREPARPDIPLHSTFEHQSPSYPPPGAASYVGDRPLDAAAGRLPLGAAAPRMEAAPGRLPHASLGRLPLGAGAPRLELAAAPDRPVGPAKLAPLS